MERSMSAKAVMIGVQRNDRTMSNTLLPTKRGAGPHGRHRRNVGKHPKFDLVGYDHCCGIHGAARERKGIKHGTVTARRRWDKTVIQQALIED
jgi:hypothetical protein